MTMLLCWLALFSVPQSPQSSPIRIFVCPQVRDGFVDVDQGALDSIRDIQAELKRAKGMVIARTPEEAQIILVVVGRRVSGTAGVIAMTSPGTTFGGSVVAGVQQPTYTVPGVTTAVPINRYAIDSVLRFGTYEKPLTSEDASHGTWRGAANQVTRDLAAWINANIDRIRSGATQ